MLKFFDALVRTFESRKRLVFCFLNNLQIKLNGKMLAFDCYHLQLYCSSDRDIADH